jgi:hypothetical protein
VWVALGNGMRIAVACGTWVASRSGVPLGRGARVAPDSSTRVAPGSVARIALAEAACCGAVRNIQAGGVHRARIALAWAGLRACRNTAAALPATAR